LGKGMLGGAGEDGGVLVGSGGMRCGVRGVASRIGLWGSILRSDEEARPIVRSRIVRIAAIRFLERGFFGTRRG